MAELNSHDKFQQEFDQLFTTQEQIRLNQSTKPRNLQQLLDGLNRNENEYIRNQVKQNILEKLLPLQTKQDLLETVNAQQKTFSTTQKYYDQLIHARNERNLTIENTNKGINQIYEAKEKLLQLKGDRTTFNTTLTEQRSKLKALQTKNAQRRAALQLSTKSMLKDEADCTRILEGQTQKIQYLLDQQQKLEDKRIDLSSQVKQWKIKMKEAEKLHEKKEKQSSTYRKVPTDTQEEIKLRLNHMKIWYEEMNRLVSSLSGIEILNVTKEYVVLCLLKQEDIYIYFHDQTLQVLKVDMKEKEKYQDLIDIVVRDHNISYFLNRVKGRILTNWN